MVDLFSNIFCKEGEVQRVREVAEEFGGKVILNEYPSEDPAILSKCQLSRAIFINSKEIGWGYGAPRDGIRKAIQDALAKL